MHSFLSSWQKGDVEPHPLCILLSERSILLWESLHTKAALYDRPYQLALFPGTAFSRGTLIRTKSKGSRRGGRGSLWCEMERSMGHIARLRAYLCPPTSAPEGIALEDYKSYVEHHEGLVFVMVIPRFQAMLGFMTKHGEWSVTPRVIKVESSDLSRENRSSTPMKTGPAAMAGRHSKIYRDVSNYLRTHAAQVESCPTLWCKVTNDHSLLNPIAQSHIKRNIMSEYASTATTWSSKTLREKHEEDEDGALERFPFGGDPRWVPLYPTAWPELFNVEGVKNQMVNGIVELAK